MCGIAGYFQLKGHREPDRDLIGRMVHIIKHRGPDEFGAFLDDKCVLGQARLSIIDLAGGSQPMANEDESIWISYNGEVYNYLELRPELEKRGHRFRTQSDTEVIIHAYEEWGKDCLAHFNGQFSFAIYDKNTQTLFAARDRMGIRPFFYTIRDGRFYFASEIKSIFCDPNVPRKIDLFGLDEIFTWWTTAPPRTAFEDISELAPGSWLEIKDGHVSTERYWTMEFPEEFDRDRTIQSWAEELHALLVDSIRLRLRADVPVGAYLSGGLDSAVTTALIKNSTTTDLQTFSVSFRDKAFDESDYQNQMVSFLKTDHHTVACDYRDIAESFPSVIWHTERPILRTAPTPLYLLSRLVQDNGFKVVVTGEGSDEILGGYDIFKETLIRSFMARNPESKWRPLLLKKLYPTLPISAANTGFYLESFYKAGLSEIDQYYFSHIPRINTTSKAKAFFSDEVAAQLVNRNATSAFGGDLPESFTRWHHLCRAQYVEARSLLAGYILSSQGDRVSAANSIEGRFPFLDHRLVEFAATIPPWLKISGLNEKYLLKKAMAKEVPAAILNRVKQPYMAPDANSFVQNDAPAYVREMLREDQIAKAEIFQPARVAKLVAKCRRMADRRLSFKDNMSFIGILSTQLLHARYIESFDMPAALPRESFAVWRDESKGIS